MSAFLGGRSGNRGECAQPCRLNFTANNNEYALSLKDLSVINKIRELEKIGVSAVKIEGRMKRPEYVAAATNACYKARQGSKHDQESLEAVFSRGGFTDGYFTENLKNMHGFRGREDVKASESVLKNLRELYKEPFKRRELEIEIKIKQGEEINCKAECDNVSASLKFPPAETALNRATTAEEIKNGLFKLGGTVFGISHINCEIDENLFVSAARINEIRRNFVKEISERIMESK